MFGLRTGKVGKLGVVGRAKIAPSLVLDFITGAPTSIADSRITFTRASVGTFFDVTGTLQTASANTPRFDFDPITHVAKGLMIEDVRTNLILNSAAPSTQNVTTTAQAYTLSFYGTGTIAYSGTATGSLVGSGAFPTRSTVTFTPTAGTLALTISGTVQDAQIEAGGYASSYIPTTGATVTRAIERVTMPLASWFNVNSGTMIVDWIDNQLPPGGKAFGLASFSDGTNTNLIRLRIPTGSSGVIPDIITASAAQPSVVITGSWSIGVQNKVGMAWSSGYQFGVLNGISSTGNAGASSLPVLNLLNLGTYGDGAQPLGGYLRRFRYWPRPMSLAELMIQTT